MKVSELIAKLTALPPDAEVVLDLGVDTFLELAVEHDEGSGVRVTLDRSDEESAAWADEIKAFPHLPG